jgi:hypothetical protein
LEAPGTATKELDGPDVAGDRVDDRRALAGVVDKRRLARAVHLAHRRALPGPPVSL